MKRLVFLLAVCCLTFSQVVAQDDVEEEEATTDVIAFFCKRDTMEYYYVASKYIEMPTDTIVKSCYDTTFSLCVTDSTAESYQLEYVAKEFSMTDTITVDPAALLHQRVFDRIKGKKIIFETDEMGCVLQLKNWSAIRNDLIQGVFAGYNELYPKLPGLEELLPKGQLMGIVSQRFQTEEGVRSWFDEVYLLFNSHGRSYEAKTEIVDEGDEEEPPSKTVVVAGLSDDDGEFDEDYFIYAETTSDLEGEAMDAYLKKQVSALGDDNELGRALVEENRSNGGSKMHVEDTYLCKYFFNGWPQSIESVQEMKTGSRNIVTRKYVEWGTRSWGNF